MTTTVKSFGTLRNGTPVTLYRMTNKSGAYVEVMDYGCAIHSIVVPDRNGNMTDVCLGYDTIQEYEHSDGNLGAVVGRHANRIAKGIFTLGEKTYHVVCNNGPNHLHGGIRGFDKLVWQGEILEDGIRFSRLSPDGEEGYPGNLRVSVIYHWDEKDCLEIKYDALCDQDTVLNLTNHSYFNLAGQGTVLHHLLQVNADRYIPCDSDGLAVGPVRQVTPVMDFRAPKEIGRDMETQDPDLISGTGYDHNYVLNTPNADCCAAVVCCQENGITMKLWTDQPGVQVYTSNFLTPRRGKNGASYRQRDGLCLETQHAPNSLACGFEPSALLPAHTRFRSKTIFSFER